MSEDRFDHSDNNDMSDSLTQTVWFAADGHLTSDAFNEIAEERRRAEIPSQVTAHLSSCGSCATRLAELQGTLALLQGTPEVEPTRSFQIAQMPPRDVAKSPAGRLSRRLEAILSPAYPALRVATAAVFLLLVSVSVADVWTHRDDTTDQVATVAETPVSDPDTFTIEAPAASEQPAPQPAARAEFEEIEEEDQGLAGAVTTESALTGIDEGPSLQEPAPAREESLTTAADDSASDEELAQTETEPVEAVAEETGDMAGDQGGGGLSGWRAVEIALLLLLAWLIVTWIGLERVKRRW